MKQVCILIAMGLVLASCSPQPTSLPGATQLPQANPPKTGSLTPLPSSSAASKPSDPQSSPASLAAGINLETLAEITVDTVQKVERLITLTGHTDRVTDLAFSGDGKHLASAGLDHKIRLWEVPSSQEVHSFPISEPDLNVIAFSPDGRCLASAEAIWDVASKEKIYTLEQGLVAPGHVAFSPDGSTLVVAGFHQTTKQWDVATGKVVRTYETPPEALGFFNVGFSPDGKWVAAGGGQTDTISFWDVKSGSLQAGLKSLYEFDAHGVDFSPDGQFLATGGTDEVARLWDLKSGKVVREMYQMNGIMGLAFSPNGSLLATAGSDSNVKLWDVSSGDLLRTLSHADELMAVAFSPDGKLMASGGYDHTISVWGVSQ